MMEVVAIGLALLGIIGWTWFSLHSINRKLDRLLRLFTKCHKEKKYANHTNSIKPDD
jgi:hypothetical protein